MMEAKAELRHWVFTALAIIGIIVVFNKISGQSMNPIGSQVGVDLTAMMVLGG